MSLTQFAQNLIYDSDLFTNTNKINITRINLEIKKSNIPDAGDGVFTKEYIPKGTYFLELSVSDLESNVYFNKMNDMAFKGDLEEYVTDYTVMTEINVGYMTAVQDRYQMFFGGFVKMYCRANKNIKAGTELSRYYGRTYWYSYLMNKLCPNCNFAKTQQDEDLPHLYIYYDEIKPYLCSNRKMSLFACKQGNKYYYAVGYGKEYYKNPSTQKINNNMIDVTKSDFSPYKIDEIIYEDYFRSTHLKQQEQLHSENITTPDIPSEQIQKGKPINMTININKVTKTSSSPKNSLFSRLKNKFKNK